MDEREQAMQLTSSRGWQWGEAVGAAAYERGEPCIVLGRDEMGSPIDRALGDPMVRVYVLHFRSTGTVPARLLTLDLSAPATHGVLLKMLRTKTSPVYLDEEDLETGDLALGKTLAAWLYRVLEKGTT